jgi:hypothetical protein
MEWNKSSMEVQGINKMQESKTLIVGTAAKGDTRGGRCSGGSG